MANIKVRDLTDTSNISVDNHLMVLTNDERNTVQNITIGNFINNVNSQDANNGLTVGTDNKLYVDNSPTGVQAGTYEYVKNLVVNDKGQITSIEQGQEANVPIATSTTVGIVKPDNYTTRVSNDGTISAISRNVGEIVTSTIPLTDAGLHLLDGALIDGSGIYSAFVDYITGLYTENLNANYFCTESEWQASVAAHGSCGKFVVDSVNNSVRLPKVSDILQGTTDVTVLGDLVEAGLPNITGTINNSTRGVYQGASGVFRNIGTQGTDWGGVGTSSGYFGFNFDASRSNSIYGNSSTVQPQTIKALFYIVVANSSKTDIQVDIDNIATDLNGKADTDLANITDSAKVLTASLGSPSAIFKTLTLGASGAEYVAPADGYVYCSFIPTATGRALLQSLTTSISARTMIKTIGDVFDGFIPVAKGDKYTVRYDGGTPNAIIFKFIYVKGSESEAQ